MNYMPPIDSILDIGANIGEWTKHARTLWPDARYHLIEANPSCEAALQATGENYTIQLLGVGYHPKKSFFSCGPNATGASVYCELTELYYGCEPILLEQCTLDDMSLGQFDLIKIDTQGSELDILRGGYETVDKAKAVLLEVTVIPFNQGAPLITEVVQYMIDIGFPRYEVVSTNSVYQMDLMFLRE